MSITVRSRPSERPAGATRHAAHPPGVLPPAGSHLDAAGLARLGRGLMRPDASGTLAETFRVLGDPTRVRILDALSHAELCVCDVAAVVGLSPSAVSHQLRLLRGSRLVRARRAGRHVFYALDDHHVVELFEQGLRHVEEGERRGARGRRDGQGR